MQLSNWNPFKFTRKKKAEAKTSPKKGEEKSIAKTATAPIVPAAFAPMFAQDWLGKFWNDPWAMDVLEPFENLDRWFGDFSPAAFRPRVDVTDEGKMLRVTAELPGLDEKDIKVTVDDGQLTITGEKKVESKTEKADCYRVERAYGSFRRVLPLPSDVDRDKVDASMNKGVLTVLIPKAAKATASEKTIPIHKS